MSIPVAAVATAFLTALVHATPRMANPIDRRRIQDELDQVRLIAADASLIAAKRSKRELEIKMGLRNPDDTPIHGRTFDGQFGGLNETDQREYHASLKTIIDRYEQAQQHFDMAVKLTLPAYNIEPKNQSGAIINGDPTIVAAKAQAVWKPQFSQVIWEDFDPDAAPTTLGVTKPDGSVLIRAGAFRYPGLLAAVLFHEMRHFEDHLDSGKKRDFLNFPKREIAHRKELRRMADSVFELHQEDKDRNEAMIAKYKAAAPQWEENLRLGLNPYTHHGSFGEIDVERRFEEDRTEDLENIRGRAWVIEQRFNEERRLREEEEERTREGYVRGPDGSWGRPSRGIGRDPGISRPYDPVRDNPGASRVAFDSNRGDALSAIARRACAQPGSISQSELDALRWFPDSMAYRTAVPLNEEGCARELQSLLLEYNRTWRAGSRLNAEWVTGKAEALQREAREIQPVPVGGDNAPPDDRRPPRGGDDCIDSRVGRACPAK